MGFLPRVNKCCFCVNLKIGTILICIYSILVALGSGGYVGSGPCRGHIIFGSAWRLAHQLGYIIMIVNIILLVCAILILIHVLFDVPRLQVACTIYVWSALIGGITSIIIVIVQYVLANEYAKEYCRWIPYLVVIIFNSLIWYYWAVVVNSYCGDV